MKPNVIILGLAAFCLLSLFSCTKDAVTESAPSEFADNAVISGEQNTNDLRYCCPGCTVNFSVQSLNSAGGTLEIYTANNCKKITYEVNDSGLHQGSGTIKGWEDGDVYAVWHGANQFSIQATVNISFSCPYYYSYANNLTDDDPVVIGEQTMCTPWSGGS